ncbi:MAG TPA: ABC transporter ATP-binding protein [Methanocella sp.]|nr:ABC transporter ATP-binding protein [Methanocella sp.]
MRAVDRLSLEVPAGIVFGFLGPNGSGKTTTIHLLLGLLEPTAGKAEVLGFDTVTQAGEIRKRSGALLEFSGVYERLSALDNLEYYGRIWKMSAQDRRVRSKELLEHLGLWERRNDKVGKWSKGMKQKLAVARTIFHRPRLAFLDEPTSGLDPIAAAALRADIESLVHREDSTVFLTTHNLPEAEKLCDRIGIIKRGKLLAVGSPEDLRQKAMKPKIEVVGCGFDEHLAALLRAKPGVAGVEMRSDRLVIDLVDENDTSDVVGQIINTGGKVEEVHKASLEEAFLSLMETSG